MPPLRPGEVGYQPDGEAPPPEPSTATVVQLQRAEVLTTDGPSIEGKEHIGGFLIIKAPDLDAALEWARKAARAITLDPAGVGLPIEVRPSQGEVQICAVRRRDDWRQILQLYDELLSITPSPIVALNCAVALAEVEGPAAALAAVDALDQRDLASYYLFHPIGADLLRRLVRKREAAVAYESAIARSNLREREFLERSRQALL